MGKWIVLFGIISISTCWAGETQPFGIVIHGGAGTISPDNTDETKRQAIESKLREALDAGYRILENGGSSTDAVVAAITILEDSPLFNAGRGSVFTYDEANEMDASIMDGATLNAGAASGVRGVKNPILLARAVMDKSKHVMLSGSGAVEFAKKVGLEMKDPAYFKTPNRLESLKKMKENQAKVDKHGTVGAVALDQHGNLSAGTSTGGMTGKRFGRIGDSPIIGAGTYANNRQCGISCTGQGEYFIRTVVAYDVFAQMEYSGKSLEQAANGIIQGRLKAMGAAGGLIGLDKKANPVMVFNTKGMYRGAKTSKGIDTVAMF